MKKKLILYFLMIFFCSDALAIQNKTSGDISSEKKHSNNENLQIDTNKYQKELDEYQKLLRQSEMLKLLIQRKKLLQQLGLTDPDDIYNFGQKNGGKGKAALDISRKVLLISTFKIGKAPMKAKIFILGLGVKVVHAGEQISNKFYIENISPGAIIVTLLDGSGQRVCIPSLI